MYTQAGAATAEIDAGDRPRLLHDPRIADAGGRSNAEQSERSLPMKRSSRFTATAADWRVWLPVVGWVIVAVVLTQALLHSLFMDLPMARYHVLAGVFQAVLILVPSGLYVLWRRTAHNERVANEELRRSEQFREDLAAMLVHDLKNPVISAALALDLLLTEDSESPCLSGDDREMMVSARRNLRRLDDMIGDILTINAGDRGAIMLDRQPTELCSIIEGVVSDLTARAAAGGVALTAADDCPESVVDIDPAYIRRVLENLVANATAHTPSGGAIGISVDRGDDEVVVSVTDTGEGIDEESSDELFDRYVQRGPGARTTRTSVGLGLAYCRIAVEAHGGRIWAENTDDGSRFSFTLPLSRALEGSDISVVEGGT